MIPAIPLAAWPRKRVGTPQCLRFVLIGKGYGIVHILEKQFRLALVLTQTLPKVADYVRNSSSVHRGQGGYSGARFYHPLKSTPPTSNNVS